jgi:class 3 adenylate cyclase/tetratricopeptide (TPR) repeat protein
VPPTPVPRWPSCWTRTDAAAQVTQCRRGVMITCERCGTESPDGFRFCGSCGVPLPGSDAERGTRKVISALFCDIAGSTALGDRLDPEVLRNIVNRYFEGISEIIERHGGTVQKYAGDAVMAVFGIPQVHEDDALRAVRAAAEIHQRVPALGEEVGTQLRFRTGVNTGVVLTDESRSLALGDAVNVAARLEQAAEPDEVLIGAETLRHVRDAVEVEEIEPLMLKGKSAAVTAFRLVRVDPMAPGVARRLDVSLVGRARELRLLRETWERTIALSSCHLFTLLGPAGVGKTRLVAELLEKLEAPATILRGRCLPYGDGITFWPLIEALEDHSAEAAEVRDRLRRGGVATPEELFLEVRHLLEALASERALILNVEDLQWAEPMLLDLLDHVVGISRGAPILVLCAARPELLESRPDWGGGRLNSTNVLLEPLGQRECEQLIDKLGPELEERSRQTVIETSEGNPLFLQEMVVLARDQGAVSVPPTIQALLAARLEALDRNQRELLEHGAIEGQVFHRSAVRALMGEKEETALQAVLSELIRKDLIRPHRTAIAGGDAFAFRHLLIRDAAYERLPMSTRADLHERFVRWLEDSVSDHAEFDEIAGWHSEQAVRYQSELGRTPDPALIRQAATHLHAAGSRAGRRADVRAARNLLERALVMSDGDDQRTVISAELAERLIEAGDLVGADKLLSEVEARESAAPVSLNRLEWLMLVRPQEAAELLRATLPGMLEQLRRAGDERALAKAYMLSFWSHWAANRATPASEAVRQAAEHARRSGDAGLRARALAWYVGTLIWGPDGVATIAAELDAIEAGQPGPYLTATIEVGRSEVARLEGEFDRARGLAQRAHAGFLDLGMRPMAAAAALSQARIEISAGDLVRAAAILEGCDAVLAEFGERPQRSTIQAMLAQVHGQLGEPAQARSAVELAEELSASGDAINFAMTHGVRARLALAEGETADARRCAFSALDYALRTDFLGLHAETRLVLAGVLRGLGQGTQAAREAGAALDSFVHKGDRPGQRAARAFLEKAQ